MSVSASTGLVRVALAITLVIALGKFAAAAWTGSSAMLAAAIHALVDLSSQGLMLIGMQRAASVPTLTFGSQQGTGMSARNTSQVSDCVINSQTFSDLRPGLECLIQNTSNRLASSRFDHGGDIYFWSYVAGVLLFSMGAGVAIYDGAHRLVAPRPIADPIIAYWVAGIAALLQGFGAWHILRAIPRGADDQGFFSAVARASDAPLLTLVAENIAGLAGLVLTVLGISIAQLAGHASADGAASMAIGLLLAAVATFLSLQVRARLSPATEPIGDGARRRLDTVPSPASKPPHAEPHVETEGVAPIPQHTGNATSSNAPPLKEHASGKHHGKKKGRHRPR